MSLIDAEQREQATSPYSSFIVQAPAGSGKTEILTQRYLRLLGTVTAPEHIVALTFTRKAASEMRERIVLALQQAAKNTPAKSAHQQKTLDYAALALERSQNYQWDLIQQPNRLKIITIDALCQSINQSIPLLEKQISYSNITDKPNSHYVNASRQCIQFAVHSPDYQEAIRVLLLHVDNKQDRLIELFTALLAQRDQWLNPLFQARAQEKAHFEEALRRINHHELMRFQHSLPPQLAEDLVGIVQELLLIDTEANASRYCLCEWTHFSKITKDIASTLSNLILTTSGSVRTSFDHHVGLKKGVCPDTHYQYLKAKSKAILEQLSEQLEFLEALNQIARLPKPAFDPSQWEVLQALFLLLPALVGHLHLSFSEHNEIDFTAISQQALSALGDDDQPTDLALYLDNAIHHLLVDEFQDTSITQYELLNKLVQGWQAGDGKTLFIVGDPMQSIYRFRQAEVGLFFRAKEQGIGPVQLNFLELACNFRSSQTVVNWINKHFSTIFPQQIDIESGAVTFHPSTNVIEDPKRSFINACEFSSRKDEAAHLIDIVKEELEHDDKQTIAILVRSRNQLAEIIRSLREHQIPYQGTDIDLLANLQHLKDVWSLTQALLAPGNRLSWLCVLRSPYCGLSLDDLRIIAGFNSKKSIYSSLMQLDKMSDLSEEGRQRATICFNIIHKALTQRYQSRLSDWVRQTLKELHSECLLTSTQLVDLEQLWALIDRYEEDARLPDFKAFTKELNKLYSQQSTPSNVQIMTIHKSKGLEFDTVILPGLGSEPNRGDSPLLRWLKLPTHENDTLFLVSPIRAAYNDHCDLYDYLGRLDEVKSSYEAQRVLYVAATRAKSRLYLLNSSTKTSKKSFKSLLRQQEFTPMDQADTDETQVKSALPLLIKLPLDSYAASSVSEQSFLNPPTLALSANTSRQSGIVTHLLLQWICTNHPENIEQIPWNIAKTEFKKLGFDTQTEQLLMANLRSQIVNFFNDCRGRWISAPHRDERNEYELLIESNNKIVTRIIDRTFIEGDTLWIIDFKTGKEDSDSLQKHQEQINEYAACLSARYDHKIHCGLYYLAKGHWIEWQYSSCVITIC